MIDFIALAGLILRGVEVLIKVLDLLRKAKERKSRNHPRQK
jgi:hypothetical protein